MKNIEILYGVLKENPKFTDNKGELLKSTIQEAALKMDKELLELLLSNEEIKEMFFKDVSGILVFDKNKFNWIIDSKDFIPGSYTAYKNRIMLTDEKGNSLKNINDVVLSFPCKDCLLEMDSTKETDDRQEVFFNETLMKKEIDTLLSPKVMAEPKRYDLEGVHNTTQISDKDNLLIKGNNLLALYSLLPRYKGKIKLMYWDILYNTESDKVPYADSFKHSSWLVMMKNRLEVAKQLLKDDGVICIQCDKNEDAYLKILCDEIFGRDNFVNSIAIQTSTPSGNKTQWKDRTIIKIKDTLLVYKKGSYITISPRYTEKKKWDIHYDSYFEILDESKSSYKLTPLRDVLIKNNIISDTDKITEDLIYNKNFYDFCIKNKNHIIRKSPSMPADIKKQSKLKPNSIIKYYDSNNNVQYAYNGNRLCFLESAIKTIDNKEKISQLLCDIWTDIDFNNTQNEGNNSLPSGKKPEALIKRIIAMFTKENDIVLDAYLGSGTTAAVAHKMGRQYIGIEQLDKHMDMAVNRLQGVISGEQTGISKAVGWKEGGSFVYCELAKNSQTIIDKIATVSETELLTLYDEIKASSFICYRVDIDAMDKEKDGFSKLSEIEKRKFLISIIDKNTLYINYADMDDSDYSIDANTKKFNKSFYKDEK